MTRHYHRIHWLLAATPSPWIRDHPAAAPWLIKAILEACFSGQSYILVQKEFSAMPLNVYKAFRVTASGDRIELGKVNAADLEEAIVASEAAFWHLMPKIDGHVIDKIEVEQVPGETAPDFDPDAISDDGLITPEGESE